MTYALATINPAYANQLLEDTMPISTNPTMSLLIPPGTPLAPGKMYLRLDHGRTDPAQEMYGGPTFGPLSCYGLTYCCDFHMFGESDINEIRLERHADLIRWDGSFYGSMDVFIAKPNDKA
jgi:hypothetical protein